MEISSANAVTMQAAEAAVSLQVRTPEAQAKAREVIQAVKSVNESGAFGLNSELTFVLDRETGRPLVRIVDKKTREVLQQIPPEYVLRMAEELKKSVRG